MRNKMGRQNRNKLGPEECVGMWSADKPVAGRTTQAQKMIEALGEKEKENKQIGMCSGTLPRFRVLDRLVPTRQKCRQKTLEPHVP